MKPSILFSNQYTIRKADADGNETEVARFHNVPLQNFYDAVIGRYMGSYSQSPTNCVHSCWFGTGSTAPSGSDTALEHPLWTYTVSNSNLHSWEKYLNEQNHVCHKYTFKVAADTDHVGTVSELGVVFYTGKSYNGIALATRALILDAEGNPITITKTELEVLYVDVLFEFALQNSGAFEWLPQNYIDYGAKSGTGVGPIFTLSLLNRIFFLGGMSEDGFTLRHATLSFSKTYANNNREMSVTGARLPTSTITSQRFIKIIGIGSSTNNLILGCWKFPNANVIPPTVLSGMQVGVGDGSTTEFDAPLAEWMEDTEEIYVNDVKQVRGVDYVCSHNANAIGLLECSILREMQYVGEYTGFPLGFIMPVEGYGPYVDGNYMAPLWDTSHPAITFAFPEGRIQPIRRFVLKNFIAYTRITSTSASSNSDWSRAVWTVQYSSDGAAWQDAGTATIDSNNVAELVLPSAVTARYWRFTISSRITGVLFAGQNFDSLMAYGDTLPITFTTPPADGAVITMNATIDCMMKNENFIIDVNPTFQI